MTLTILRAYILRAYIGPHREIDDETELLSLGLTDGHKECIAAEIEDACGVEIPGDVIERWERVADVARDVGEVVGVEAV